MFILFSIFFFFHDTRRNEQLDEKSLIKKLKKKVAELETELACLKLAKVGIYIESVANCLFDNNGFFFVCLFVWFFFFCFLTATMTSIDGKFM